MNYVQPCRDKPNSLRDIRRNGEETNEANEMQSISGINTCYAKFEKNVDELLSSKGCENKYDYNRAATASILGSRKALLHEINDVNTEASKMGATCGKKCNSDRKQQRKEALIRFVQRLSNIFNKNRVVPFSEPGSRSVSSVISKTTVVSHTNRNKSRRLSTEERTCQTPLNKPCIDLNPTPLLDNVEFNKSMTRDKPNSLRHICRNEEETKEANEMQSISGTNDIPDRSRRPKAAKGVRTSRTIMLAANSNTDVRLQGEVILPSKTSNVSRQQLTAPGIPIKEKRAATASILGSCKALLHEINDVNTEASKMGATCGKKCNSDRKQQRKEALIRFVQRLSNIFNKNRVVPFSEPGSRSVSSVISKTTVVSHTNRNKSRRLSTEERTCQTPLNKPCIDLNPTPLLDNVEFNNESMTRDTPNSLRHICRNEEETKEANEMQSISGTNDILDRSRRPKAAKGVRTSRTIMLAANSNTDVRLQGEVILPSKTSNVSRQQLTALGIPIKEKVYVDSLMERQIKKDNLKK
ncbi:unnamed protein product [Mytilus edulis]|uniref:Uncharacterized protein n=1 Tax=Mytilus edulis TaxID=6550 RepID=A0A8S3VFK4_MYTED|nr:unnamed protein product [Mytilus edulis]